MLKSAYRKKSPRQMRRARRDFVRHASTCQVCAALDLVDRKGGQAQFGPFCGVGLSLFTAWVDASGVEEVAPRVITPLRLQ